MHSLILNLIFFLIIQQSQMTEQHPSNTQQSKKEAKANNRWTNISSDEDQSESEHSQKEEHTQPKAKQQETLPVQTKAVKEDVKKREPHIVPFDARKKFRGEFANIKTVKGGFKAQKLQQKKFRLDTVKNPFQVDDESSDEEKQEQKTEEVAEAPQQEASAEKPQQAEEKTEEKAKKSKKSKKQQEKEQLQALLKQLNVEPQQKGEEGQKKKKKKKAKKQKGEGQEQPKQQNKPEEVKVEPTAVQQQVVNRQTIEQVMRKKAEAAKNAGKKGGKQTVASNARKAIEEREAKNKLKKVYVDL